MADDVTAILAAIRERGYRNGATGAECARLSDAAAEDVPSLVAAVKAVLKAADSARSVDDVYDVETDSYRPVAWNLDPAKVREAIRAALSGKEAGDGK